MFWRCDDSSGLLFCILILKMVIARAEVINWGRALRNGGGQGGGSLGVTGVAISVISEIMFSDVSFISSNFSPFLCRL